MDQNNSAYLVKSAQTPWEPQCMLAVDAGCLASGILDILKNQMLIANNNNHQNQSQNQSSASKRSFLRSLYDHFFHAFNGHSQVLHGQPSQQQGQQHRQIFPDEALPHDRPIDNTWHVVNSLIASVCVTHPHLDHIAGLVINSGRFCVGKPKTVAGLNSTIDALTAHIFNGVTWPNLTNEGVEPVGMINLVRFKKAITEQNQQASTGRYAPQMLATNLAVLPFPVSHGTSNCYLAHQQRRRSSAASLASSLALASASYQSTAFFIRDSLTHKVILIWGDVEPDVISHTPRNLPVWTHAAHLYAEGRLCAVLIECSYPSPHEDEMLFGHFTPRHLVNELKTFAALCGSSGQEKQQEEEGGQGLSTLEGLSIIITHVKDEDPLLYTPPPQPAAPPGSNHSSAANTSTSSTTSTQTQVGGPPNSESKHNPHNFDNCLDSPSAKILADLKELGQSAGLLCQFEIAVAGHSYVF